MFGTHRTGVNAYANVGIETGVAAASPYKLIVMLFDGAAVAIRSAIVHMNAGDVPAKGLAVSKAINIIENGLRASLDKKAGGAIAASLDSLYEYMGARLLQANMNNDVTLLEEVQGLLSELRSAWNAIGTASPATQGAAIPSFEGA
jgi:flagellar protein FliS